MTRIEKMANKKNDIISDVVEFWKKLKSNKESLVKFVKKDGTTRLMRCTLNFKYIPKEAKPKSIDVPKILNMARKSKVIRVYDIESHGWRSIPFDKSEWLEDTDTNTRYSIKR